MSYLQFEWLSKSNLSKSILMALPDGMGTQYSQFLLEG